MDALESILARQRAFIAERHWEQFHTPKNLAMALAGEAGELLEQFQWLTPEQSSNLEPGKREAVSAELADILIYLLTLSDRLGIDLVAAAHAKFEVNAKKYPVERVRGNLKRADEYEPR